MSNNFDIIEALWLRREKKRRMQKTIEGAPPLTYTAKKAGTLTDYRIYGQTENGESVGDRTGNLFDGTLVNNHHIGQDGLPSDYPGRCCITTPISIDTESLFISYTSINVDTRCMYSVFLNGVLVRRVTNIATGQVIDTSGGDELYVGFYLRLGGTLTSNDIFNIMLNSGSTALPYEPYGYRVPVTVTNRTDTQTTKLYLLDQIRKVGDEAEYIDFREQKQHFADGTSVDVTLPALPTLSGTNTLSVGTEVQPSKMMIKGKIKE